MFRKEPKKGEGRKGEEGRQGGKEEEEEGKGRDRKQKEKKLYTNKH